MRGGIDDEELVDVGFNILYCRCQLLKYPSQVILFFFYFIKQLSGNPGASIFYLPSSQFSSKHGKK